MQFLAWIRFQAQKYHWRFWKHWLNPNSQPRLMGISLSRNLWFLSVSSDRHKFQIQPWSTWSCSHLAFAWKFTCQVVVAWSWHHSKICPWYFWGQARKWDKCRNQHLAHLEVCRCGTWSWNGEGSWIELPSSHLPRSMSPQCLTFYPGRFRSQCPRWLAARSTWSAFGWLPWCRPIYRCRFRCTTWQHIPGMFGCSHSPG